MSDLARHFKTDPTVLIRNVLDTRAFELKASCLPEQMNRPLD
jgi:hypothetical protein